MPALLEIACFNIESAKIAQSAGADRIEFCASYHSGGITPSSHDITEVRSRLKIPMFVMIRPRGGDFVYHQLEILQMRNYVRYCKSIGVDGLVFGLLNNNHELDIENSKYLVDAAHPLPCTLHRAFDETEDKKRALEEAIETGFTRILTAGGKGKAIENIDTLNELITLANNRITILPGGGIRSENIALLKEKTKAAEFHTAAVLKGENCDEEEIKKIISILK